MTLSVEQTGGRRPAAKMIGRMTEAEFVRWCGPDTWAEWVDGEVILMSPVNLDHAKVSLFLKRFLADFVEERDLGMVVDEPFQVRLAAQRRRRSPDILFVATSRLDVVTEQQVEGAPDLIIEVVSPESQSRDRREKFQEYQSAGVREYWIVDPVSRTAEAYALGKGKKYRAIELRNDWLDSVLLSGFGIRPGWLWRQNLPKLSAAKKELAKRK